MKRYCTILVVLVLMSILLAGLIACAQPTSSPATQPAPSPPPAAKPSPSPSPSAAPAATPSRSGWPKAVTVCSSSATGTFYVLSAAVSDIINKKVGLTANVEAAGGSPAAVKLMGQGLVQLAIVTGPDVPDAYYGIREQQGKPVKMRLIMNGHPAFFHLMTLAKSGINTAADMNGKRYQFDKAGSANRPFGQTLIKAANLNVKVIPWESSEATCKDVAAGTIDVGQTSAIGAAAVRELFLQHDARLVSIPDNVRDEMVKLYPGYVKASLAKDYYQAKDGTKYPSADLPGVGYDSWLTVRADMPDDLVYEISKAIMDNAQEFGNYHSEAKYYTLQGATDNPQAPFHPGVVRYYKEKGVWTEALQKQQDKFLSEEPK